MTVTPSTRRRLLELAGFAAVGIAVVLYEPQSFDQRVLTMVVLYALAGIGLNVLVGYAGIVSVGHAAFLLIGAYSWALLADDSPALAVATAVALGAGTAWVLGWICLRFRNFHLLVATLAFGLLMFAIAKNWETLTGGNNGVIGFESVELGGLSRGLGIFVIALVLLMAFFWLQDGLRQSRLGIAMLAARGDELAASSVSLSVRRVRNLAFIFSAVPTVIAGALLGQLTTYVHPDQFRIDTSVALIAIPIVGGRGWRWAPILGALFVIGLPEYFRVLGDYRLIAYGALLVAVVLFLPDGLRELLKKLGATARSLTATRGLRVRSREAEA
jgi:branched-chain amino acid transport system permease protein